MTPVTMMMNLTSKNTIRCIITNIYNRRVQRCCRINFHFSILVLVKYKAMLKTQILVCSYSPVHICFRGLSHKIWEEQDGTTVVVGGKTNQTLAEFPEEMKS